MKKGKGPTIEDGQNERKIFIDYKRVTPRERRRKD
jgi:hypothetical protein